MITQEKTNRRIALDGIDPLSLYGVNNGRYRILIEHFPNLEIVARGNEILATGTNEDLDSLEEALTHLVAFFQRWGELNDVQMSKLLSGEEPSHSHSSSTEQEAVLFGQHGRVIKPRTPTQAHLVAQEALKDLIFAVGPAGTGKTYMAIALAVRALKSRQVRRIILTRPAVEAGERLGFLPGDMKEKLDPYLQPLYDALNDMLPPRILQAKIEDGTIQIAPLAFMRGRTLDHAFVILDEAQNATLSQMKMFLTRMGRNAKFIVTGDVTQVDLPRPEQSGLSQSMRLLSHVKGVEIINFTESDIVRHPLVIEIVRAFERVEQANS